MGWQSRVPQRAEVPGSVLRMLRAVTRNVSCPGGTIPLGYFLGVGLSLMGIGVGTIFLFGVALGDGLVSLQNPAPTVSPLLLGDCDRTQ